MESFNFNKIYVLESLDEKKDDLTGTELYDEVLRGAEYKTPSIKAEIKTCNSKNDFLLCLDYIKRDCAQNQIYPIIHFEIHGSSKHDGLVTANLELISWEELYKIILDINVIVKNNLFITLAVCHGAYLMKVINILQPSPFWGFIGSFDSIEVSDLLIRYKEFYQNLLTSFDLIAATKSLHESNKNIPSTYKLINSEEMFQDLYNKYIQKEFIDDHKNDRWKRAAKENGIILTNRSDKKKFEKEFNKEAENSQKTYFLKHRRIFFMIDKYPENKDRFSLNWRPNNLKK